MRIFIYEFVTGGGWYEVSPDPPSDSLLAEGRAMVSALVTDFAAVPDVTISCIQDQRISVLDLPTAARVRRIGSAVDALLGFTELVEEADFVLLIAPEIDGHLWRKSRIVEQFPRPLLSQPSLIVAEWSNKWSAHNDYLRFCATSFGPTPTPKTIMLPRGGWPEHDLRYPLVAKPIDGCGSIGVQLLQSSADIVDWSEFSGDAILQEHKPGTATSISILCGPTTPYPLPACRQLLSKDGRFRYLGGECPLPDSWFNRAYYLAGRTVGQDYNGWLGVDLILGEVEDGSQDYVIEINPRLTTSYVGLRVLSQTNLAQAMLDVAQGREPQLAWKPGRVNWTADGAVEYFAP